MRNKLIPTLLLLIAPVTASWAGAVVSDGSLGPFNPTGSQTINLEAIAPDGVLNYTTVNIPAGVEIRFSANAANTPVFVAATGDIVINGTIDVSAGHFNGIAGPGGGAGGQAGSGGVAGSPGEGLSPGAGGPPSGSVGNGGGGGGLATEGLVATLYTGPAPAPGGEPVPAPELQRGITGGGGSGGGGGGHGLFFGVQLDGGVGGGGSGAVQLAAAGQLTINGIIRANGGHAGWAFANVFSHGGPGGGGSGGFIELYAADIEIGSAAVLQAIGGAGGGLSTQPVPNDPWVYSSRANGGQGYLRFGTNSLMLDPAATIEGLIVPNGDVDGDGVFDIEDNCVTLANPDQRDTNADGFGNVCDADLDGDCVVSFSDLARLKVVFFSSDADTDFDGDGFVNFADLGIMKAAFFGTPGPSAIASCP